MYVVKSTKRTRFYSSPKQKQMAKVLTASDFKTDMITFNKNKPNTNGGFNCELTFGNGTDELVLQSPKMRAPFGIGSAKQNPFKKSLDVSFQGMDKNKSIAAFREMIEAVDKMAIDYALKNSETFFKKQLSREVLSEYYYSGIKISKKQEYSDTFKFKILYLKPNPEKNLPDGKFVTSFWAVDGQQLSNADLDRGDSVKCLIKPQMLWVSNKMFGITWVCTQICVHKQQKNNRFGFKKTEDDEPDETINSDDGDEYVEEEVEVDA